MADLSLSEAVQRLWELDSNRLEPNTDYVLNVQVMLISNLAFESGLLNLASGPSTTKFF